MEPVKRDMELLSNSMATYAHIKGNMSVVDKRLAPHDDPHKLITNVNKIKLHCALMEMAEHKIKLIE